MSFQLIKIPELPSATSISATCEFPVETPEGTKRVTQSVIDSYTSGNFLRKDVNESTTGTITAAGFTVNSSEKIKENIRRLDTGVIGNLLKLTPVSYTYKKDSPVKPGQHDIGLIAEQVKDLIPELTVTDDKGNISVDYAKLSVYLLLAIKTLIPTKLGQ